jgi:hypothetical protein
MADTDTCYYTIADQGGANWEVGIGTYATSGNILERTTVLSSSAGGTTKANFASGNQAVFITYTADKSVNLDVAGNVSALGTVSSGTWQGSTIAIAYGGTNSTATPSAGGIAYGTGTAYAITSAGTSGQLLTSNGISAPTWTDGVTASSTTTFTNKRITPRVSTTTSSSTPAINTDDVDMFGLTAQAAAITSFTTNLTGTPTNGQKLWIYIVGTAARAITWGASFEASTVALPTTTVTTNRLDVGFVWNAATSKWRCVAAV